MTGEQSNKCSQKRRKSSHDDACEQPLGEQSRNHGTNDDAAPTDASSTDNFFSPINYEFYKSFKYCSLDKSNRSIRLLHVSKDPDTGRRSFTLTEERSLSDARDTYTAISYCAGDPKNTRELLVNGIRFNAFANLARAIDETCHYRESEHNETSYLLWTDQICINQSDPTERSHQVGMMYDVYANAREVAVNLSTEDSPYIDEACAWMTRMAPSFPEKLMNPLSGLTVWGKFLYGINTKSDEKDVLARGVINDIKINIQNETRDPDFLRGFSAVLSAFAADWWTRAWVVQEFRASQAAVFIIGQCSVKSAVLMAIKLALLELRYRELRLPDSSFGRDASKQWASFEEIDHIVATADSIKLLCGYAFGNGLGELLQLCQSRKATDARDKVYAYLGLVSSKYEIKPNYDSQGPEGVRRMLIETARQMILYHKNLNALHWVFPKQSKRDLPSWVPDWTDLEDEAGGYNWDRHKFSSADPEVSFSSNDEVLSVRGAYIGTLDHTKSPSKDDEDFALEWTYHVSQDCYVNVLRISRGSFKLGDQAWMLFGSGGVFLLREENGAFRLIGLASAEDEMGEEWKMEETCEQRRINII